MSECGSSAPSVPLIYVMPQGGIGNQLFQMCAGLAVQKELGGTVYMLPTRLNKHSGRDYRHNPQIYTRVTAVENIERCERMYRQADSFEPWSVSTLKGNKSIVLDGYFQYLPAIRDVIPLVISDMLSALCHRMIAMCMKYRISSPSDAVFLHVRRGDYVPLAHIFGGVGEKYYTDAMKEYMSENLYGKRFLVISDDPEWCRGQAWLNSYEVVNEPDELDSLALMASCKGGAIIANSTFSWWGAHLSGTRRVFYPSKWLSNSRPDLFPAEWLCVGV
jgi:hypothetical protein